MFDGGYVHHGLLKAATFILNRETEMLRRVIGEVGEEYKLVFAGHSLGSGVAALMTVIVVNHRDQFGGIERRRIRCYAIAPARCMSLNLAVKYADVINSVVLQDDFLPRTPTPLEHIFGSIFCLPCFLFLVCLRDTFIPESRKLNDPRRLYAPGRLYHIVERKFCRCGRFPPEVRTAIPVEGRFEHIVLSCNATSDHALLWIEREAQKIFDEVLFYVDTGRFSRPVLGLVPSDSERSISSVVLGNVAFISALVFFCCWHCFALFSSCRYFAFCCFSAAAIQRHLAAECSSEFIQIRKEDAETTTAPTQQKMERKQTLEKEYKGALERAVTLNVPHAISPLEPTEGEIDSAPLKNQNEGVISSSHSENQNGTHSKTESKPSGRTNWDELVEKLFTRNESGNFVLRKDIGNIEGH
ncbi:hypothetical protein MA16_Dca026198 [Dendrobium catenatum]|uniref:Fungal lipase-type domain-containing protein n=1 Tax=Dendrobium catenatum TaxID=906689 RepID=A0A2I0VJE6_9ASPA|nr:hypothetical protein MA16_Dca026198 [Dendrobium catenatum]